LFWGRKDREAEQEQEDPYKTKKCRANLLKCWWGIVDDLYGAVVFSACLIRGIDQFFACVGWVGVAGEVVKYFFFTYHAQWAIRTQQDAIAFFERDRFGLAFHFYIVVLSEYTRYDVGLGVLVDIFFVEFTFVDEALDHRMIFCNPK
tara:strand:+ start:11880 stop:12320 length:441 start_codon:yes stop_codon:yes gene_type:complete